MSFSRLQIVTACACLLLWVTVSIKEVKSQDEVFRQSLAWFRVSPSFKINPNWTAIGEVEYRMFMNPSRRHQLILPRLQVLRSLSEEWKVGGGVMYMSHFMPQFAENDDIFLRKEFRSFLVLKQKQTYKWGTYSQRIISEQRWLELTEGNEGTEEYRLVWRFRYAISAAFNLNIKKNLRALAICEPMLNAGKGVGKRYFDQLRLTAGLRTDLTERFTVGTDYLKWIQPNGSLTGLYNRDILRVTV